MTSERQLEQSLRNLAQIGTLVKDRGYRQVWRFEHDATPYFLKFYPRAGSWLKRMFRGNPALREFVRLQWLQKANIPAPRPHAYMSGFRIGETIGDAVILEGIEPSVQLDRYLNDLELRGEPIPDHHALAQHLRTLVYQLGRAKLGHSDLHLGNFLLHEQQIYLLDGYAVRKDGLRMSDVMLLGHSASRWATRTDLQRAWELLGPGGAAPRRNPDGEKRRRKFLSRIFGKPENEYFGSIEAPDGWRGAFFKHAKFPRRWSAASKLNVTAADWERVWPDLLKRIESDQFEIIKRTRSGDVLAGEIVLAGKPIQVVIKRPRRKFWWRWFTDVGRGPRPRRAWKKSWNLISRNIPVAWPILTIEKVKFGYTLDSIYVAERVPGKTLTKTDLNALDASKREMLLRRIGRILRQIDDNGYSHFDAKASNWIIVDDEKLGPTPVMVDVDGIRAHTFDHRGIRRLLRSMEDTHPQYSRADSLALCQGYAPYAPVWIEEESKSESETKA